MHVMPGASDAMRVACRKLQHMSSLASPEASSSPLSLASAPSSGESTPRTPTSPGQRLQRAFALPDALLRRLEDYVVASPGPSRPTSADRRLPLAPPTSDRPTRRRLDFSQTGPADQERMPPVAAGTLAARRPPNLTPLDLRLIYLTQTSSPAETLRSPGSGISPEGTYRSPSTGVSPAGTRNPSTGTSPAATFRSNDFDPTREYVEWRHDEARRLIDRRGQDAVHALLSVVVEVLTRTEAPTPPAAGRHTPLWKDKVDNLDPALLDKLPALALARRLKMIHRSASSGIALFDRADSARFAEVQTLTGALLEDMMADTPPRLLALLGGEQRARANFLKIIAENIERGIETRDFPEDPRYLAIATRLQEASYELCDLESTAQFIGDDLDARRKNRTALTQRVMAALP